MITLSCIYPFLARTNGAGSIRDDAIEKYKRMREQTEMCPADNMDRLKINLTEVGLLLYFVLHHYKY